MNTGNHYGAPRSNFLGLPQTRIGRWSVILIAIFLALFLLYLFYSFYLRPIPRPTFFSDPLMALLVLSSVAAAISAALCGVLAIVVKDDWSFVIVLSTLLGAFVLYMTICEVI
jgi:hypothetical protein